jgi:hypothetical protein
MRTILTLAAAVLAVTATSLATSRPHSSAAAAAPTTLTLVSVEQRCGGADLPPRDGSPGDLTVCRGRLHDAGTKARAGRAAWFCPYTGAERFGDVCTAVASLRTGDITLAGRLSHTSAQSTWAVTGGSGAYAGARGTAVLRQVSAQRTAVTISLL